MEHIIDALEMTGYRYDVIGPLLIVHGWNGTGTLQVAPDPVTGWATVTEIWDDQSRTDEFEVSTVVSWITGQVHF